MEKFTSEAVAKSVSHTLRETFETMLEMSLETLEQIPEDALEEDRLVGSVYFGGEVVGVLSLHVSKVFAKLITSAMLGAETDDLEEIKDVLGELANIVAGNLKTEMVNAGLACVISTPSITRGTDFRIDPTTAAPVQRMGYRCGEHYLLVDVAAKEEAGAGDQLAETEELSSQEISDKINTVDIRATVINSVIDVFYTMLSMEVEHIKEIPPGFIEGQRTVGTVTFAGDVDGLFNIQVNDDFARIMTASMLGMEVDEIESEEEINDVIRELSNIIGGNLKSQFVDAGLACVLSPPSITRGRDFRVEALNIIETDKFLFSYQDHTIIVEAGIKKDGQQQEAQPAAQEQAPEQEASQPETVAQAPGTSGTEQNLDLILNIPLELTVELGRTKKKINELLSLGEGSIVALKQLEGEPVDILVNDTLIARGQVVLENEKYGIKILEIVSRKQRLNSIR